MVIDKTSNFFAYKKLFSEGIFYGIEETLNNTDILFENAKLVNVIDGKLLYRKMSLATVEKSEVCFETHRDFVDVHLVNIGDSFVFLKQQSHLYTCNMHNHRSRFSRLNQSKQNLYQELG